MKVQELRLLQYVHSHGSVEVRRVMADLEIPRETYRRWTNKLIKSGHLQRQRRGQSWFLKMSSKVPKGGYLPEGRCDLCFRPTNTGRWCPACKAWGGRKDRQKMRAAITICEERLESGQWRELEPLLVARDLGVRAYDHDGGEWLGEGLITRLITEGVLTGDLAAAWRRRQRNFKNGLEAL